MQIKIAIFAALLNPCKAYGSSGCKNCLNKVMNSRRDFGTVVTQALLLPAISPVQVNAMESEESQLYNVDEPVVTAQSRTVTVSLNGEGFQVFVDGSASTSSSSNIPPPLRQAMYQIPSKWSEGYMDTFSQKACERIIVYQTPLGDDTSILDKATSVGVAKALGMLSKGSIVEMGLIPATVQRSDIISASKKNLRTKNDGTMVYYEFDVAIAPEMCSSDSDDNLGLGFCPYDSIILISATVVERTLLVCCVLCTKDEWKRSSSDIKRVRSSFRVNVN